jgi:hypothetical protein
MKLASGRPGPADLVAAHKWFNIAVARGYCMVADFRSGAPVHNPALTQDMAAHRINKRCATLLLSRAQRQQVCVGRKCLIVRTLYQSGLC